MDLSVCQIEKIFQGIEGGLNSFERLFGGAVNTTYKIIWNDVPYVLRFYVRDDHLAQVEREVYRLIDGDVPVPKLLKSGLHDSLPYALFTFVDKKHIYEVFESSTLSYALGKVLSCIHHFHFPKAGLFGAGFAIHTSFEEGSSPYFSHAVESLSESSRAWKRLGESRARRLREFLDEHQDFFPTIHEGGVLVHSDFKPVNLLWDEREGLTVLDWEFAHSGHPLMDFAILLRHFKDFPCDIELLEKGYREHGGTLPDDWIRKARLTDAVNVIALLNTPMERPQLFQSLLESIDLTISKWPSLDAEIKSGRTSRLNGQ